MSDDTLKKYGVDIAVRRADDLDKRALRWIEQKAQQGVEPNVLDLGCGAGGQSVRMATAGALVVGIDVVEYQEEFAYLRAQNFLSEEQLRFMQADMRKIPMTIYDSGAVDMCVVQRVLHYLPHGDALRVLRELKGSGVAKLFVSVTGVESDIGRTYADASKPIEHRFCTLSVKDSEVFSISQPVCLYTPEEFMVILQEAGWKIEECWISAFGNIKAVCSSNL